MDAIECRKRAAWCLRRAAKTSGELRDNFLLAAETWVGIAEEFEGVPPAPSKSIPALAEDCDLEPGADPLRR